MKSPSFSLIGSSNFVDLLLGPLKLLSGLGILLIGLTSSVVRAASFVVLVAADWSLDIPTTSVVIICGGVDGRRFTYSGRCVW